MIYAHFFKRVLATFIDFVILTAIGMVLIRLFMWPLALILNLFYKPIFEASNVRGTPGKFIMEIAVVKTNGEQITLKDSYIRYLSSFLSSVLLGFGYLLALFNDKNRTLHDYFAGTVVIEAKYENAGLFNEWLLTIKSIRQLFS